MCMGQRKSSSPWQDSNLWPPRHWAGALSTELRRTHGERGHILKVHIWHASCILLGSAMLRSYCLVKEWKIVKFTIFHFFTNHYMIFLVNNHVFSSDWMTPKHWLPKVIISGSISSISYHHHHTDPADSVFYILTMEDSLFQTQRYL